jgi:hypothetical protein
MSQMASGKTILVSHMPTVKPAADLQRFENENDHPTRRHSYVPTHAAVSGRVRAGS